MKKIFFVLLVLANFGAHAQHDHSSHASQAERKATPVFQDEKMGSAYNHYIQLKDALVASNVNEARKAAIDLEKELAHVSTGKKAQEAAKAIASASKLDDQRATFSTLSNEMTALVKSSKLSSGALYVEYCPMANHNEGGFWLSNEREIKNPYFGNMMLKCGSVKETVQ